MDNKNILDDFIEKEEEPLDAFTIVWRNMWFALFCYSAYLILDYYFHITKLFKHFI